MTNGEFAFSPIYDQLIAEMLLDPAQLASDMGTEIAAALSKHTATSAALTPTKAVRKTPRKPPVHRLAPSTGEIPAIPVTTARHREH